MAWLFVGLLAAAAFGATAFLFRAPRRSWEAIAAALLLGLAGYAFQANPDLAGAPKTSQAPSRGDAAALVEVRHALSGRDTPSANRWVVIGDAMVRNGRFADAAGILLGAVEHDPEDSDAWLALGNALAGHAEGTLTPAALHAFRQAAAAAPDAPGPPYFLGLALAQSGRLAEARATWARLLHATPSDSPLHALLTGQIQILDTLGTGQGAPGTPQER